MFDFRLFPEKTKKKYFFFEKPHYFGPLCPFLSKTECSSKFCCDQFFFKKIRYHCAKFRRKSNEWLPSYTSFRRTHAHMHGTCVS